MKNKNKKKKKKVCIEDDLMSYMQKMMKDNGMSNWVIYPDLSQEMKDKGWTIR